MDLTAEQVDAIKSGRAVAVSLPEVEQRCVVLREDVFASAQIEPGELNPRSLYPAVVKVLDEYDDAPEQYLEYLSEPR